MRLHARSILPLALCAAVLAGCAAAPAAPPEAERAGLVTLLGTDTLAVEQFTRTADGITARVVLRSPETRVTEYQLRLAADGALVRYTATTRRPGDPEVVRFETAVAEGDSVRVTVTEDDGTVERVVGAGARPVPFVDMVHWPYVLTVERAVQAGAPADQPMFTPRGAVAFTTDADGAGGVTVTHPFRGPMTVQTDAAGRLLALDAAQTTRKVTVTRVDDIDVDAFARRAAAADAAGRSFGALSGRGETRRTVGDAEIVVDFGQPLARGRQVWGSLVPWNEVWRTGANRATHVETSRALVLGGGLAVPAGRYTLFSIPQPDGGLLIVNRETGQGGTGYDPSQDLGRVAMTRTEAPMAMEAFAIDVEADGPAAGRLVLRWDRDTFSVPFVVAE